MLLTTKGIVLRSVKYGDTSLICTIFTEALGVQTYMVQGVRTAKARGRAGLLQPATLLDMVVNNKPNTNLQRIKEYDSAHIYMHLQEEIVKNSIALFSIELLLRLLPEHAPMPELFNFAYQYFCKLDEMPVSDVANFPVYFIANCSSILGYEVSGRFTQKTQYLNLQEGGYSDITPSVAPYVSESDAAALSALADIENVNELKNVSITSDSRYKLLEWYISFLHSHTQYMGDIRSLDILRAILH